MKRIFLEADGSAPVSSPWHLPVSFKRYVRKCGHTPKDAAVQAPDSYPKLSLLIEIPGFPADGTGLEEHLEKFGNSGLATKLQRRRIKAKKAEWPSVRLRNLEISSVVLQSFVLNPPIAWKALASRSRCTGSIQSIHISPLFRVPQRVLEMAKRPSNIALAGAAAGTVEQSVCLSLSLCVCVHPCACVHVRIVRFSHRKPGNEKIPREA